jgi:hypothetical protein
MTTPRVRRPADRRGTTRGATAEAAVALPAGGRTIRVETVESIRQYVELIEGILAGGNSVPWYRGCRAGHSELKPTLFRHRDVVDIDSLKKLERQVLSRFKQQCVPYLTRSLDEPWEYVFLAQHFGVPTRLLDWTENPFVALYFALETNPSLDDCGDSTIWILDPAKWNQFVLAQSSYEGGPLSTDDPDFTGYEPSPAGPTRKDPVGIYGTHNSARIVAQKGVFTIFGLNISPMEEMYLASDYPADCLVRVNLPSDRLDGLRAGLSSIGITHSVIWQDLDGLARDIKREFAFDA